MTLTEAEATQRWCPFVRTVVQDGMPVEAFTHNRSIQAHDQENDGYGQVRYLACLGSKCMAWKWHLTTTPQEIQDGTAKGRCGMAGKP